MIALFLSVEGGRELLDFNSKGDIAPGKSGEVRLVHYYLLTIF